MKNRLFTAFWQGGDLNPIAYTSIKSFLDYGHSIQLFSYKNIGNAPKGMIARDAAEILPLSELDDFEGRIANFSDLFRYAFLYKEGGFWIDTDVVCIREEVPSSPIYLAYEIHDHSSIGAGALALPRYSSFAKALANYAYDPGLVTPWEGDDTKHRLLLAHNIHSLRERRARSGDYTFYGPLLLTNAARHYNYMRYAKPYTDLYTIGWSVWRHLFFDPKFAFDNMDYITAWAIHCWGSLCCPECDDILKNGKGQLSEMVRKNWKSAP